MACPFRMLLSKRSPEPKQTTPKVHNTMNSVTFRDADAHCFWSFSYGHNNLKATPKVCNLFLGVIPSLHDA